MALVSTPSLEGFNSFVSVEEADEYFSGVYFGSGKKWSSITDDDEKAALLITASRKLSMLPWGGSTFTDGQSLAFPRVFNSAVAAEYGIPMKQQTYTEDDMELPTWLKQATFEMAHWLMTEDDRPATDAEFSMLKGMKIGPLDYTFRDNALGLPPSVSALLSTLGSHIIDFGSGPRTKYMVL